MYIKDCLDEELSHVKIDKSLYKKLVNLETSFVNKNQEYIEFFGGNLTGVQVIRFTDSDRLKLFEDVLDIDEGILTDKLLALRDEHNHPVITENFVVVSDTFNIVSTWLIHAIDRSKYLSEADKHDAKMRVCLYLIYRFFTSRYFRHFIFPADVATAKATYEALSYKYIIKQKGNWYLTFQYLAESALSTEGINDKVIQNYTPDVDIFRMISDTQGKVRSMLKNIYGVFKDIHDNKIKITSNTSHIEIDGEVILKDTANVLNNYTTYIHKIVHDKNSFIKDELVSVVCDSMKTMPGNTFMECLEWISDNYSHINNNKINEMFDSILHHSFSYLHENRLLFDTNLNLVDIITKLRGVYMSSRTNDHLVLTAREQTLAIVKNSIKTKNDSILVSVRTGLMIYIVLRAITMKHYR